MQGIFLKLAAVGTALLSTTAFVCAQVNLKPAINYNLGANPSGFATGDFDGDGDSDLAVVTNDAAPKLTFLINDNKEMLSDGGTVLLPRECLNARLAAADVTFDGTADLVLLLPNVQQVWVMVYAGCGGWIKIADEPTGIDPHGMVIGDIDNNGALDIVIANTGSDSLTVLMNFGIPEFINLTLKTGAGPKHVALGDLNPEKNIGLDLVVANAEDHTLWVFYNNGFGKLALNSVLTTGGSVPDGLTLGDWNLDGYVDIAVAGRNRDPNLSGALVYLNSAGHFDRFSRYVTLTMGSIGIASGDLNGDGKLDLVTADAMSDCLSILTGKRGGRFAIDRRGIHTDLGPDEVLMADVDGDGDLDVISLNMRSTTISVVLNGLKDST